MRQRPSATRSMQIPAEFPAQAQQPILSAVIANKPKGIIAFPDDPVGITAKLTVCCRAAGILVHTLSADIEDKSAWKASIPSGPGDRRRARRSGTRPPGRAMRGFRDQHVKPGIGTTARTRSRVQEGGGSRGPRLCRAGIRQQRPHRISLQGVNAAFGSRIPRSRASTAPTSSPPRGAVTAVKQLGLAGKVLIVMHDTAAPEVAALQ